MSEAAESGCTGVAAVQAHAEDDMRLPGPGRCCCRHQLLSVRQCILAVQDREVAGVLAIGYLSTEIGINTYKNLTRLV